MIPDLFFSLVCAADLLDAEANKKSESDQRDGREYHDKNRINKLLLLLLSCEDTNGAIFLFERLVG